MVAMVKTGPFWGKASQIYCIHTIVGGILAQNAFGEMAIAKRRVAD